MLISLSGGAASNFATIAQISQRKSHTAWSFCTNYRNPFHKRCAPSLHKWILKSCNICYRTRACAVFRKTAALWCGMPTKRPLMEKISKIFRHAVECKCFWLISFWIFLPTKRSRDAETKKDFDETFAELQTLCEQFTVAKTTVFDLCVRIIKIVPTNLHSLCFQQNWVESSFPQKAIPHSSQVFCCFPVAWTIFCSFLAAFPWRPWGFEKPKTSWRHRYWKGYCNTRCRWVRDFDALQLQAGCDSDSG